MQVALAWLLRRAPNILLIPGTSSLGHLRENLAAAELTLPDDAMATLDGIGRPDRLRGGYLAESPATIGQPPSPIGRNACSAGIVSSTL